MVVWLQLITVVVLAASCLVMDAIFDTRNLRSDCWAHLQIRCSRRTANRGMAPLLSLRDGVKLPGFVFPLTAC